MRKTLLAIVMMLVIVPSSFCLAAVIPANRMIDWSHSGVPGGIPNRTTIFTTISAATYGNGTTDASAAINAAIANCPKDQVVYLPEGTYRLNGWIYFNRKSHVTLRGAGMGRTILIPVGISQAIVSGEANQSGERQILSGSTKGSTAITVSSSAGIEAGMMLDLYQANDTNFFWSRWGATDRTGQHAMVTAVNGTTIQIEDPLVWDFTLNPRFRYGIVPGMKWSGVEDLTIRADSLYDGGMIKFNTSYACWIKNVEMDGGNGNEDIYLYGDLRSEVSGCYIHDSYSTTDGYGILTMASSDIIYGHGGCTGLRVENNIFSGMRYAMVLETEVGSVFAYNYTRNIRMQYWPNYHVNDYIGNHGPHGMMYLFEGNSGASGFQQDGYHGSVSHVTLFRNYFSGVHNDPVRTGNVRLIDLCRFSRYHNIIGNVLGSPAWPRTTTGQYEMTSGMPDYTQAVTIYRLGYPNPGNYWYSKTNPPSDGDAGGRDFRVKETLYRWGNFDYQNNATRWEASEVPSDVAIPADHYLPASLYLSSKPAWWGNTPWPAIGPDVAGLVNKIPAQVRYEAGPTAIRSFERIGGSAIRGNGGAAIYDISGRVVFRSEKPITATLLKTARLSRGIYVIKNADAKSTVKHLAILK